MYFLFTDETNVSPKYDERVKFFAYGGLIIPIEKATELSDGISKIRTKAGYLTTDSLKFDTRSRPAKVTQDEFKNVKAEVVDLCLNLGCVFLVYVVLHRIAEAQKLTTTIKWGADHIVGKFNYFLEQKKSKGVVVVDRFSDVGEYAFLSEKFTSGLVFPGKEPVPLDNIELLASSCDNASNFSSAMDIVLGSFRYCINQPLNEESAKIMMKKIAHILWADKDGENLNPFEKGLTFRPVPKTIRSASFKKEYDDLIAQINTLLA